MSTLIACSLGPKNESKPAQQEMYENAMSLFQRKKYERAVEAFKAFKEEFPLSQYTPLVELHTADALFFTKKYAEAIVLYEEFKKLHPLSPDIPYATYQVGMCHFKQMRAKDQDQTETEKGAEQFRYLLENFPQCSQAGEAKEKMQICQRQMAEYEYYIGDLYFRSQKYKAALGRFENILQKYPGMGLDEKIKQLIPICQEKIAKEGTTKKENIIQ